GGGGVARAGRVQHVEEDALVLVGRLQLLEIGGGGAGGVGAVHLAHQHDSRGIAEIVELVRDAGVVGELEVVGPFGDQDRRRGRRCDRRNTGDGGNAEDGGGHG